MQILSDDLKAMKRVLRRLGCTSSDNVVEVKGRVACEVDSADELVVTELIFNNAFSEFTIEQARKKETLSRLASMPVLRS